MEFGPRCKEYFASQRQRSRIILVHEPFQLVHHFGALRRVTCDSSLCFYVKVG